MNVLVISHTYISPINRDKWKILAQRYPRVLLTVVFPQHWPTCLFTHAAHIDEYEQLPNCKFVALAAVYQGNELLYWYYQKDFYRSMRACSPDIIHVEQGPGALSYFQANLFKKFIAPRAKSIFFSWINWQPSYSFKHKIFLSPIEKINLCNSHGAIVGNNDALSILEKKGFEKPVLVLPQLGVNMAVFKPSAESLLRARKTIGFIGRFTPEKGIELLFNVFKKLTAQYPEWDLVFAGTGPSLIKLKEWIANNCLEQRVKIHEPVPHDEIVKLLHTIDILVLPSYDTSTWREQFGHILIEAMACKIPVIGSNAGEIPHVIGQAGIIFEQCNEDALLAQLQTLMQDEDLRRKLGECGLERVHDQYSHESIADQTYNFWQHIMN